MRNLEEIKKNKNLVFDEHSKYPFFSGVIILSNGKSGSFVMSFDKGGIEHVSMKLFADRLPKWNEMCELKETFWEDEEEVVQIHPKKSEYVNFVEALHLWRPSDGDWNKLMGKLEDHRNFAKQKG